MDDREDRPGTIDPFFRAIAANDASVALMSCPPLPDARRLLAVGAVRLPVDNGRRLCGACRQTGCCLQSRRRDFSGRALSAFRRERSAPDRPGHSLKGGSLLSDRSSAVHREPSAEVIHSDAVRLRRPTAGRISCRRRRPDISRGPLASTGSSGDWVALGFPGRPAGKLGCSSRSNSPPLFGQLRPSGSQSTSATARRRGALRDLVLGCVVAQG